MAVKRTSARKKEPVTVETEANVVEPVVEKEQKKIFKADDLIPCRSVTGGKLFMTGMRTGITYEWIGRNDVVEVEYQDLSATTRSHSSFVFKPSFIIEDEDFVKEFPNLKRFYDDLYQDDFAEILAMDDPNRMGEIVKSLPEGAKESLKGIAATMIKNGQLDSVAKIRVLDSILNTKLMLTTELYNE